MGLGIGSVLSAVNPVAAIGSALSVGGDVLAYKGQKDTNQQNAEIARENRVFQERMANSAMDYQKEMSNTAYSRGMQDMKSAGLNPILAYSQGGASTPVGHGAPGSVATMQNPAGVFSGTANSINQSLNTASNVATQSNQRDKIDAEIEVLGQQEGLTNQQIHKVQTEMDKLRKETLRIQADTTGINAENVQRQVIADFINSAELVGIAKYIGINPTLLKGFARILSKGAK
ncbi:MAG: DNA pilot protein [Microviridae sp.]|nr:MAG: DNA pilot protein [Microviridae sp.]